MKYLTYILFILFIPSIIFTQNIGDTTIVETLDFNDITKRRGWYIFPSDTNSYHKVLMYYTLKCDAATTQDMLVGSGTIPPILDYTIINVNTPFIIIKFQS